MMLEAKRIALCCTILIILSFMLNCLYKNVVNNPQEHHGQHAMPGVHSKEYLYARSDMNNKEYPNANPDVNSKEYPNANPDVNNKEYPNANPDVNSKEYPNANPDVNSKEYPNANPDVNSKEYPNANPDGHNKEYPNANPGGYNKEYPNANPGGYNKEYPNAKHEVNNKEYPNANQDWYNREIPNAKPGVYFHTVDNARQVPDVTKIKESKFASKEYLVPMNSFKNIFKTSHISLDNVKSVYGEMFRNPPGRPRVSYQDDEKSWVENGVEYKRKEGDESLKYFGVPFHHPSDYQYHAPFNQTLFFHGKRNLPAKETVEPKIILWYRPIGYVSRMDSLKKLRFCPDFPCRITTNKKYTNESSALVFDGVNIKGSPPPRKPGQVFVFHFVESPVAITAHMASQLSSPAWRHVFNWTMTYRTESDIPVYYGLIRKRPVPLVRDYKALISRKTKMAATLISHCYTNSKREEYITQLKKYIDVDVYGGCGKYTCARGNDTKCGEMIGSTYKFYFAFENALCKDYFTEKFFRYMNTDAVVVARGGEGYWRHVPPEIFINAANFKSPKELADYLIYLDNNPDKYEAILREKSKYVSLFEEWFHLSQRKAITFIHYHYEAIPFCQMCQWLWNVEDHVRTDLDLSEWLKTHTCEKPRNLGPQ